MNVACATRRRRARFALTRSQGTSCINDERRNGTRRPSRRIFLLCLLAALAAYAVGTAPAWATLSGPNYAGAGASATGVGTVVWTNPGYITAADTSYATCALSSSAQSNYLWATNFGFAIPAGNVINGIPSLDHEAKRGFYLLPLHPGRCGQFDQGRCGHR